MKRATITEAKNHVSALLAEVRTGETIVIMDRGVPIAASRAWPRLAETLRVAWRVCNAPAPRGWPSMSRVLT